MADEGDGEDGGQEKRHIKKVRPYDGIVEPLRVGVPWEDAGQEEQCGTPCGTQGGGK